MVKVIGLGFGRSGTMSLKAALEELGFGKCYHFSEIFDSPGDAEQWLAASRGHAIDWDALLDGYGATVYLPPGFDPSGLLERHPDLKAVLLVRDPDKWYESTLNTVYKYNRLTWYRSAFLLAVRLFAPQLDTLYKTWALQQETLWDGVFHGRFRDKAHAIAVYGERIEQVERIVPAERLLIYSIKDGWEPLCHFLGVAPPDKPFPRLNDTLSFVAWRTGWWREWLPWLR